MTIENDLIRLFSPLILIRLEENKNCLGHHEYFDKFKHREDAKKLAINWRNKMLATAIFKKVDYNIVSKHGRRCHRLYHLFTHIDDIKACKHYQIEMHRKIFKIESKHFVELITVAIP